MDETGMAVARRYLKASEGNRRQGNGWNLRAGGGVRNASEPASARHGLAEARAGAERGKKLMLKQTYEVSNEITQGDWVVMEVRWVLFQTVPAGGQLRARFAMFLQFSDGKIVAQRNYDCHEPW